MEPQKLAFVLVALNLLQICSTTQPTFEVLKAVVREYESTTIRCYIAGDETNEKTSQVSLWKSGIQDAIFEVTKFCDSTAKFSPNKDTTKGRLKYDSSSSSFRFENLTQQDTGTYRCSLVSCTSPVETVESKSATLTVNQATLPTTPVLYVENNDTGVYEETLVSLSLTCSGFVGYPRGVMNLVFFNASLSRIDVKSNMAYDSEGFVKDTVNYTYSYQNGFWDNTFVCETIQTVNDTVLITLWSSSYLVPLEYKPSSLVFSFTTRESLPRSEKADIISTYTLRDPGLYTIKCSAVSQPVSTYNFTQVGGPTDIVQIKSSYEIILTVTQAAAERRVVLNCKADYKSTTDPPVVSQLVGDVQFILPANFAAKASSSCLWLITLMVTLSLSFDFFSSKQCL